MEMVFLYIKLVVIILYMAASSSKYWCEQCGLDFTFKSLYDRHMATVSHKFIAMTDNQSNGDGDSSSYTSPVPQLTGTFSCDVCQLEFQYKSKYERHLTTLKHKQNYQLFSSTRDILPSQSNITSMMADQFVS